MSRSGGRVDSGGDGITATAGEGSEDGDPDEGGDGATPRFDVYNPDAGLGPGDCEPGMGGTGGDPEDVEFSYIWIANSLQGTVSKIDTFTATEVARYVTGPEQRSQPSRTSVSLYGDAVVVNRGSGGALDRQGGLTWPNAPGSITKIYARERDCVDTNGNGTIDTSTGPGDIKAWGEDECIAWNQPLPNANYDAGGRPVGWEALEIDGCASPDARVWVGYFDGSNGVYRRLNGATGATEDEYKVPINSMYRAKAYGGAVTADGSFWTLTMGAGPLVRVDVSGTTSTVDIPAIPMGGPEGVSLAYGLALDATERVWLANTQTIQVYDPASGVWNTIPNAQGSRSWMRGLMVDREGRAFVAHNDPCGMVVVDTDTASLINPMVPIPGCREPVGISIDVEGFVWMVDKDANAAFKIDPDTYAVVATVTGLIAPYTYSDMTGAGLALVARPPAG